ncbi:MAG TPA: rod shape-determining protein MreC [Thermomicrobiales bacterium]|nr:rod shape-determining protein MreC [Thermomicrobiales bacterium]
MNTIPLRQTLTLVMIFVIISTGFILLDRRAALDPVRDGMTQVVAPVSSAFTDLVDRGEAPDELEVELARVTAERDELKRQNSRLKGDQRELESLRLEQDASKRHPDYEFTAANVIGGDATGAQMFIIIDRGSLDGVTKGMAITSPHYYVGQVAEVTEHTAKVMLIVDASQNVGAMLEDSRADGIVYGQLQLGGYLMMRHVEADVVPNENEWIVTSRFPATQTRQVPPDIPIGQVLGEPKVDTQTDSLVIEVRPGVSNFDDLRQVWIVTPKAGE